MKTALARVAPRNWTIRARLTALYGGVFVLAGTLLLGSTYLLVQQRLENQAGTYGAQGAAGLQRNDALAQSLLRVQNGRPLTLTGDQLAELRKLSANVLAAQEAYRRDTLESLLTQGALALGGVTVIAVALGWVLAGRGLRPVHRITETARRIADSAGRGLHERIALAGPRDEIKQLADTFDAMLERLDRSFDGQRRFIASASHEMRTPLAINRALIEVSVTRPGASPDTRTLGESLLQVNARHERLIDGLLTLADSENDLTGRHPVDLSDVVRTVLAETADTAGEAGVTVRLPRLGPAPATGDPYLLERLVHNLVENAVRHNVRHGGWLAVRTGSSGDRVWLEVTNTGPVVHRYETEAIFEPFRRLGDRRAPSRTGKDRGFGLGLSIVRAIAGAHGGHARAEPRPDGGLTVTVTLPARTPEDQAFPEPAHPRRA
ncbi:Signal transduction histidine kinase [Thermomonospora echinospora]|uniref:histidine kinase n=1 Tax=Thermomonospora echinospora TaxID=1992 RepID=A0A1H6CJ19_9ACTN|nr:HAMP domain-containing sensor histidine kinase [Thermomonospora echinospora]SEG72950.1 Signal transduction histidine kinase [Thermomonospora echinospora]